MEKSSFSYRGHCIWHTLERNKARQGIGMQYEVIKGYHYNYGNVKDVHVLIDYVGLDTVV